MLSNSAIADVPFERVWSRMTAAEAALVLVYANLAASVPAIASHYSAEGALTVWGWNGGAGSYFSTSPYRYSGGVFSSNRRPDQVRPLLQASYEADRAAFIDAATDSEDGRGWALVDELPPIHPGPRVITKITFFDENQYTRLLAYDPTANARANLVQPIQVFRSASASLAIIGAGGLSVAQIAAALAAKPAGCRAIKMGDIGAPNGPAWGVPVVGGAANGRVAMFEREFDTATRRGLGMNTWQTAMLDSGSDWIAFWDALLAQGEALLGTGHGHELVDEVILDVERLYSFWNLRFGGSSSQGGETWTTIFSDSEWSTLRTTFFLPVLAQGVWDDFANWNIQTDERAFAVDACLKADYVAKWAPVAAEITDRFSCTVHDYDQGFVAVGTRPVVSAAAKYAPPYGLGGAIGNRNSFAAYGADFIAEWRRWHWPTLSQQVGTGGTAGTAAERVWRMLVAHLSQIQSLDAASTVGRYQYLSDPDATSTIFGAAGDLRSWAELVLHATLAECDVSFYDWTDAAKIAHLRSFVDLIAERDELVGFAGAKAEPQAPFDEVDVMRRPAIVSKVFAGWRWIWRVTPNPFLAAPKIIDVGTINGPGIRFDWGGGRVLEIPRGKLVRVAGSMATSGYWVEQPLAKRFRYSGSVALGTTPQQIVPAPLPNWARRLLVRSNIDATDLVHAGNSGSVNGTKGNANCGWPLDAGEERSFELSRDIDGGDETGVWARAASGTQFVHWWVE